MRQCNGNTYSILVRSCLGRKIIRKQSFGSSENKAFYHSFGSSAMCFYLSCFSAFVKGCHFMVMRVSESVNLDYIDFIIVIFNIGVSKRKII